MNGIAIRQPTKTTNYARHTTTLHGIRERLARARALSRQWLLGNQYMYGCQDRMQD
eukprot:COSAG01_NODE_6513_length_3626_cov_5.634534_2_plen_56_part_00